MMKYIFDPFKDEINIDKHGLSLSEAKYLEWDEALHWVDTRKDYGEVRLVALAPMENRLFCVVFIETNANRRIISLRKANNREIDRYEKEID